MIRVVAAVMLLLCVGAVQADQVQVRGVRLWSAPDQTRLVVDLAAPVKHAVFPLSGPERLVIDVVDARLSGSLPAPSGDEQVIAGLRSGVREGDDLRIVVDLKQSVRAKSFLLPPNDTYGHRLVIDLEPRGGPPARLAPAPVTTAGAPVSAPVIASAAPISGPISKSPPLLSVQPKTGKLRDVVIAIDAGHGGEDPGAIGAGGTREKDITLAIARKLAARVDGQSGMRAVMIRDGDYFVPLRSRIEKARKQQADLFVSIHADAFTDRRVRGSSVFTLSQGGATSEAARRLAERENRADLIGGIDLKEQNEVLASVLLDMTQNATIEHSGIAATKVLHKLRGLGEMHATSIQKAGFAVLKSPDVPSMLVETAFISNPDEEKRLRSGAYQNKLADSLLAGIIEYFNEYPPPDTRFARRADRGAVKAPQLADEHADPAVPTAIPGG